MNIDQVFGIAPTIRENSYVDRGALDEELRKYLGRHEHIALKGESKCGKSWLRQNTISNALIVQCRLTKTVTDLYVDALSQLDIKLEISSNTNGEVKGSVTAKGELGLKLLVKIGIEASSEVSTKKEVSKKFVGHDIEDLRFVADLIKASGRRLVIEDFHYMTIQSRTQFAFDLKAFWDYEMFVVIIGVWSQSNMLFSLNPDLTGRVHEMTIEWGKDDLKAILVKGGKALNLSFSTEVADKLATLSFSNAGILQKLTLMTLEESGIKSGGLFGQDVSNLSAVESAALSYAEELNPLYQQFAKNVSSGIRDRKKSTGIYAYSMSVILETSDDILLTGLKVDVIFQRAHAKQPRIKLGNLKVILGRIEGLQIDADGRGMVLSYNQATEEVNVVDKQLLLYRTYCTVKWPWEALIAEASESDTGYDAA